MYKVGEKIIYGELGVFTVQKIAPLDYPGADENDLYYYLVPYLGTGVHYAPVNCSTYMRSLLSEEEVDAFIASIPAIEPAVCNDNRFNHVDMFYKEMFKLHTNEALVAIIKGLCARMSDKKTKSSRAELTVKRAKDILYGEFSAVLDIPVDQIPTYISDKIGACNAL